MKIRRGWCPARQVKGTCGKGGVPDLTSAAKWSRKMRPRLPVGFACLRSVGILDESNFSRHLDLKNKV